jgi:hypothetical protein
VIATDDFLDETERHAFEEWMRERELRWQDEVRANVHRRYVQRRDSGVPDADEGLEIV